MNSKNYWKRRALLLEQLLNTRAEATVQQISRLYGLAQEQIFQQIEKVFSSYVRGGALNPDKAMQLLTVRETEEARALLLEQYQRATGQVKRDIWARLSAPAYANRIGRLQALRDSLYTQARMVGLDEVSYVRDRLSDTLEQSYYRTTFDIQQYTGEGYDFSLLNDNQITAALAADWSGKNWSERLWDNNQRFADAVEDTVTVGIMAGLRYDEMRDNLLHVIGMDATEGARYRSARLVKTECAYIANQGHLLGYQAAEIERYIFLATLDLRTSEVCRSLDMKRFSVAEAQAGENLPPMHPHCRSTTMPDMTDEQLRKVSRAARDPATGKGITVPGDMKYPEWYEKYVKGHESVAYQNNSDIIKNIELPSGLSGVAGMTDDIKDAILQGVENVSAQYRVSLDEISLESLGRGFETTPFQYQPINRGGFLHSKIAINSDYNFNGSLEAYQARIMRNYNRGILAAKSVEDLLAHEMAHVMTFQDCERFSDFLNREQEVRTSFVRGISAYADRSYDGAESIAEAFVRARNGEAIPHEAEGLLEKYIERWRA